MEIETDRLILREWKKEDKEDLIENINNVNIVKNLMKVPFPYGEKDAYWWINHCAENQKKESRENYEIAIELKSEGKPIGGIGLNGVDEFQNMAELGYWLGEKYWRQGIMSEAIKAMLDFGFNKLNLRRIFMYAYVENDGSNRIADKFGFRLEGTRIKNIRDKATRTIHSDNGYGLLKEEWEKNGNN